MVLLDIASDNRRRRCSMLYDSSSFVEDFKSIISADIILLIPRLNQSRGKIYR